MIFFDHFLTAIPKFDLMGPLQTGLSFYSGLSDRVRYGAPYTPLITQDSWDASSS
jgi:hypothetical protein